MKRMIAIMLAVLTLLSVGVLFVSAEDGTTVYVTISDKDGKLPVAAEKVNVTDIDGDKTLTINDVLYCAHEQFYEGGAAAGFATETTKWGLSLMKLWGEANGGSYGYMVNNIAAYSMTDPVKENDYVAAYVFTDTKFLADKYSFFDKLTEEPECAAQVNLQLKKNDFDQEWKPLVLPVAGAEITVNGEPTGIFTDEDGRASVLFDKNGKYLVSATAKDQVIVPPVCVVEVSCYEEATPDEADVIDPSATEPAGDESAVSTEPVVKPTVPATEPATKDSATKDSATKDSTTAKTGDVTNLWLWILISAACLCGIVAVAVIYKKRYAK